MKATVLRSHQKASYLEVPPVPGDVEIVEIDEVWNFVNGKNKVWIWKAYDPLSGRNIAWEMGSRSGGALEKVFKEG